MNNNPAVIKANLDKAIEDLAASPEIFSKNPKSDFTRSRKLPVSDVPRFPILMERDSADMELLKYFNYGLDSTPAQSAYIQQRSKLIPGTFKMLLDRFNGTIPAAAYQGKYILYGVDGSGFNIAYNPDDPDTFNPPSSKSKPGNNEIHVVASYRLTDHIFTDAVIQPCRKKNEHSAVCGLTVERIVTRSHAKKTVPIRRLLKCTGMLDRNTKFDYMEPGSSDEYPLTLRVARINIAGGRYENLITDLPADEFDTKALRALYYIRWGLETASRYLEHAVGAQDFHCKSFENVTHEVWARLILFNCCSAITALAVPEKPENSKYEEYQVNYTMAIKNVHTFLRQKETEPPIAIIAVIERYTCPVRPERNFERRHRYQAPLKFNYKH